MVRSGGYRIIVILFLTSIQFPLDVIKMSSIGVRVLTVRIQTVSETFPISRKLLVMTPAAACCVVYTC